MSTTPESRLLELYDRVAEAPDAIERLRKFVLDLAMGGKLVAQDSAEEPPTQLLKQARRDLKERAATTKRMRWKQTDPVSSEEIGRDAPSGWLMARINDTGLYINGLAFKPADWKQDGIPIIRIQNLTDLTKEFNYAQGEFPDEVMVRDGDLLVSWSATLEAFKWHRGQGVLNQHIFRVMPHDRLTEPGFLLLLLRHAIREMAESEHAHGLVMTHINRGPFLNHPVLIPPLPEQHRIVARVDELMALLDRLETTRTQRESTRDRLTTASLTRLTAPDTTEKDFPGQARFALNNLDQLTSRPDQIKVMRQTILNLAVRGQLVKQDPQDEPALDYLLGLCEVSTKKRKQLKPLNPSDCGGDLPESWVWLSLGAIIRGMNAGWSPQCENHPRSSEDEWGVLKTTAVQALAFDPMQHKLLPTKLKPRPEFQAEVGDILVTRAGPKNRVGVSCVVDVPCSRLMISDKLIRFHVLGQLSPRYIALTLNAGFTFEQIETAKSGMAVMQMNISQSKLRAIPIPLPPLAEQHRIVAKVDALMALCDRLEAILATADTARARLLDTTLHESLKPSSSNREAA